MALKYMITIGERPRRWPQAHRQVSRFLPQPHYVTLALEESTMLFSHFLIILCKFALSAVANRHHFCWCASDQAEDHDLCLTEAACARYPQDKFFRVHYELGDPNAKAVSRMNFKREECYGTREWPVIPKPYLGGNEFEDSCYAAAKDPAVVNACIIFS
ncbi:hypothetical protein LZ32DRAFT_622473 [Colletotrichum eremochloae]|nr:hypothetical protein LZ32DRAFT_622473 [Colletotrichum eremochloae]